MSFARFTAVSLMALLASPIGTALAAPALKAEIIVASAVVTVGDMFEGAGAKAEEALFRAPAPGSAGTVSLEDIRAAAAKIGLTEFSAEGISAVRVARTGTVVDETMLATLMAEDLKARGILTPGMSADALFDASFQPLTAEAVDAPAQLLTLRYLPGTGAFTARFAIAGRAKPLDVTGEIELLVEVPHLTANLPAGSILQAEDIEMKRVPLRFAETNGFAAIEQLVGKQLTRQTRLGTMLRPADVGEPQLISRNEQVTVYFRQGPMTLTAKGQALNDAARGEPVAVLNQASKKVVHGVALESGAVEITSLQMNVAGL